MVVLGGWLVVVSGERWLCRVVLVEVGGGSTCG